jgi:thiamine biosynthesis lipoprotein
VIAMPLLEKLPVGPDTAQWPVWGTTARLVVTRPDRLGRARTVVDAELAAIDRAASRFRPDSEVRLVHAAGGRPVRVSPLLAELVAAALAAAHRTEGRVDPTLGGALAGLGYDRDLSLLPADAGWRVRPPAGAAGPAWQRVRLAGDELTVPAGVLLDLGATGKAYAADRCARLVAEHCGTGVLVALGGDIATAGEAPEGGWRILVSDGPDEPSCTVAVPAGAALATSSTLSRRWRTGGHLVHHILDPRTCRPARPLWRTVSVVADRCVAANTLTTAAVVRGATAPTWLRMQGVPARLVPAAGPVLTLGGWPAELPTRNGTP